MLARILRECVSRSKVAETRFLILSFKLYVTQTCVCNHEWFAFAWLTEDEHN